MNEDFDDSALLEHAGVYDPAKARAYYLRTRHLKGRRAAVGHPVGTPLPPRPAAASSGVHVRPSRQKELLAQKAALTKRLDRLKSILSDLVTAAKARSGVETPTKQTASQKAKATADKNQDGKDAKPLTAKQKADKREASKKQYQKENGSSPAKDVEALHQQIQDIQGQIAKALTEARKHTAATRARTPVKSHSSGTLVKPKPIVGVHTAPTKPQTASKGR